MLRDPIIQNLFPEIFEFEEAVDVIGCLKEWPKTRLCDDKAIVRKTKIDIKILLKQLEIMLEARKRLEYNVNIELFYMELFIKCKKAFI